MNLMFAILWLVLSVGLFALPWLDPQGRSLTIGNTNISAGWFGLLLFLYNLARWWIARNNAATREAALRKENFLRRRPEERREKDRPYVPPDPNFNFTEEPPRPGGGQPEPSREEHYKP